MASVARLLKSWKLKGRALTQATTAIRKNGLWMQLYPLSLLEVHCSVLKGLTRVYLSIQLILLCIQSQGH